MPFTYVPLCFLWSYYPSSTAGLGSSAFARHYLRNHFCFLFLQVLRCFNSLGSTLAAYVFCCRCHRIAGDGLPHSDTPGSLPVYGSPRRFAVCCVLLLLYMPRHPPYALLHLITTYREICFRELLTAFSVSSTFFSLLFLNFTERPICLFCYSVFKDHPSEGSSRSLKTKQVITQPDLVTHLSP